MNYEAAEKQWWFLTALPADENGFTNPYGGGSVEEYRGRGYGTKGLAMTLDLARKIVPEDEIYLRVLKTNVPSFKVIMNNGACIAGEDEDHYLLRVAK